MSVLEIVGGVLLLIAAVVLIAIVLAQHGKTSALGGAITGGASESFLGKKGTSTADATMTKLTRIAAIVFVALVVAVEVVMTFAAK